MEMSIFYDSDFVEICIPDKLRSWSFIYYFIYPK